MDWAFQKAEAKCPLGRLRPHTKTTMTLSNLLSLARILLTVPALYFLSFNTVGYNSLALAVALLAALTDYLDGKLARRYGAISALGKYLDPIADKVLLISIFIRHPVRLSLQGYKKSILWKWHV